MAQGRKWTQEELEYLHDKWGIKTIPQIAKAMGKSENAVKIKSVRIGLGCFKDSSEYLPALQVSKLLGIDVHTVTNYWIPKCGLKFKWVNPQGGRKFKYIKLSVLEKWLEAHPDNWDSRRVEMFALGFEPDWLKEKRKADQLLPSRKAQKYTRQEDMQLIAFFKTGRYTYQEIGDMLCRSRESVERRISRLDVWGTGKYIGNVKSGLRKQNRENLTRLQLISQLHDLLLARRNELAFDGFWQKDMCTNWHDIRGCTAGESDCDSCTSFVRIKEQYCVRCGKTFFERDSSRYCSNCRETRKRQQQKKWATMKSRGKFVDYEEEYPRKTG